MFRLILFAAMLLLAACAAPRPTPTPSPTPDSMVFTIDASVEPLAVQVGDMIDVSTDSGRAGLAYFSVFIDGVELSRLSYNGTVVYEPGLPTAMKVVEQNSASNTASWTLEALESGVHELKIQVSGEISLASDQSGPPWGWSMADRTFNVTVR